MVIILKIWQIIIVSSKFALNWLFQVFLYFWFFSTNGGVGVGQTLS